MDWMEELSNESDAHRGELTMNALTIGAKDAKCREGFLAFEPIAERALDLAKEHGLRSEVKYTGDSTDLAGGGTIYSKIIIFR